MTALPKTLPESRPSAAADPTRAANGVSVATPRYSRCTSSGAMRAQRTTSQQPARLLVYTVSTGGYDIDALSDLRLSRRAVQGIDFIRFVDADGLALLSGRTYRWQTVLLNHSAGAATGGMSPAQRLSRDIKIRPHRYEIVWRYDASLYIDSNVRVHQPVHPLFARVANGSADLGAYDFPRGLDGEAEWIRRYLTLKQPRFNSTSAQWWLNRTLKQQVARYKAHGDHMWNRTMYGKVILRWHSARIRLFGELWWREYSLGVPRDQLSFRFCAREAHRRCGFRAFSLGHNGRNGARFWRYFGVSFGKQSRLAGF